MQPTAYRAFNATLLKMASEGLTEEVRLFQKVKDAVPKGVTVVWDPANKRLRRFGGGVYGESKQLSAAVKANLPKGDVIMVSRQDPVTLAHEAGHAEFNETTVGKVLQNTKVRGLAGFATPLSAVVAGSAGSKLGPLGGALLGASVPFLVNSPVLIGEAVASMKGVDRLREAGMSEEDISKAKKQLLKAFATYAAIPALSASMGAVVGARGK